MYKLKLFAQRTVALGAVATLVTASLPPVQALAYNELNPLTERSLLLSSSAPGYIDTDGSGNSTDSPNPTGVAYAPAGSGANGKKTGQTFSFKVSTDSIDDSRPIKAFSFQYCTTAAGDCFAPGTNSGDDRADSRETNAVAHDNKRSDFDIVNAANLPFEITHEGTPIDTTGWTLAATPNETIVAGTDPLQRTTGKNNYITLSSPTGFSPDFNDLIEIKFTATEDAYITNPGWGSFFVKINTYDDNTTIDDTTRIDGGVTVANMMTDSIHITTKVLETMQFSVGIDLPENQTSGFTPCSPIEVINNNRIDLGNPNAENSLETDRAHEQKSYWRIQSNSSGGATIYYSGDTLRNTVGDSIQPMSATKTVGLDGDDQPLYEDYGAPEFEESKPSSEQFGLALVSVSNDAADGDISTEYRAAIDGADERFKALTMAPLDTTETAYDVDAGAGNAKTFPGEDGDWLDAPEGNVVSGTGAFAQFGFTPRSVVVPEPLASGTSVLSCTTGKMRYVGNIAADTPAGVYTTKVNYLAAPKY